jgi:hypothetical protein
MCVTSVTTTGAVAFAQELLKRRILFKRLANRAMEHPNEIIEIFNGLVLAPAQFYELLDELPVFSREISIEFCSLLRKVLSHFPASVYKPPACERCVMSVTWSDSERNGDAEPEGSTFDLWTFSKESHHYQSSPHKEGFWYYMCGITHYRDICIACAELSHHGHDVVLATFDSGSYDYGTNCLAYRDPLPSIPIAADRPASGPAEPVPTACSSRSSSSCSPLYTRPDSPRRPTSG